MNTEKLIEAIDGSCGIEIDEDQTVAIVWYGGTLFHMYSLFTWEEIKIRNCSSKNGKTLSGQKAREFMRTWLKERDAQNSFS